MALKQPNKHSQQRLANILCSFGKIQKKLMVCCMLKYFPINLYYLLSLPETSGLVLLSNNMPLCHLKITVLKSF